MLSLKRKRRKGGQTRGVWFATISSSFTDGDMDMRRFVYCLMAVATLSGCGQPDDEKIVNDVQAKIVKRMGGSYGRCDDYKFLSNATAPEFKNAYLLHCDNFLNPKSLSFSDIRVYRHNNFVVVCGVVSGKTDLSRQGNRVVEFWDREDGAEMQSKYSGIKISDLPSSPVTRYRNYYQKYCN